MTHRTAPRIAEAAWCESTRLFSTGNSRTIVRVPLAQTQQSRSSRTVIDGRIGPCVSMPLIAATAVAHSSRDSAMTKRCVTAEQKLPQTRIWPINGWQRAPRFGYRHMTLGFVLTRSMKTQRVIGLTIQRAPCNRSHAHYLANDNPAWLRFKPVPDAPRSIARRRHRANRPAAGGRRPGCGMVAARHPSLKSGSH